jgi:hypothetical protein
MRALCGRKLKIGTVPANIPPPIHPIPLHKLLPHNPLFTLPANPI